MQKINLIDLVTDRRWHAKIKISNFYKNEHAHY
jgi:hypothetical protein